MRLFRNALLLSCLSFCQIPVAQSQSWESVHGPPSGEICAIAATDSGTLFLAAGIAGLWRSTDDGVTWDSANTGLDERDVRMVSFQRDGNLYASTYHSLGRGSEILGRLYRSTDDGLHWDPLCLLEGRWGVEPAFREFAVNSKGHIYTVLQTDMSDFVELSTDGGMTWHVGAQIGPGSGSDILNMATDGSDSLYVAGTYFFIVKSADSCTTWRRFSIGSIWDGHRCEVLAVAPNGCLFAGASTPDYGRDQPPELLGVYRVSNDGSELAHLDSTWQPTSFTFTPSGGVYATGTDGAVRRSTDNGDTWIVLRDATAGASTIQCTPRGSLLYGSTANLPELVRSTNGGTTWNAAASPPHISFATALLQTRDSVLWAGNPRGTWSVSGPSNAWTMMYANKYVTPRNTRCLRASGRDSVYAAVEGDSPSSTGGSFVHNLTNTSSYWQLRPAPHTLDLSNTASGLVGTEAGIFAFNPAVPHAWTMREGLKGKFITGIVRNRNDTIFASAKGEGVYRSGNGAATWVLVDSGLTDLEVTSLALDSTGRLYAGTVSGLFTSTNDGGSWTRCAGFPAVAANVVAVTPQGHVYAGTTTGVYCAHSSGDLIWQLQADGLPVTDVRSLAIGVDGYVYAGTYGAGVFRIPVLSDPDAVSSSEALPVTFMLEHNFPNPFNPATVIRYHMPAAGHVRIAVYDLLGRQIRILVDETKAPGRYSVEFNAGDLPSGVYLYQMQSSGFVQVRTMLFVK